jgi:phosphohistidine phosphatase
MKRTLYLLRHAKSSWDDPDLADVERPLAPRGRRAAATMARHVRMQGFAPELVLCSPSVRTRDTLERVAAGFARAPRVEIVDDLYQASAAELLARLRVLPDELGSAMLVGHHPALPELALALAGSGPMRDQIAEKFPTGALATLAVSGPWHELTPGNARLVAFVKPRELEAQR